MSFFLMSTIIDLARTTILKCQYCLANNYNSDVLSTQVSIYILNIGQLHSIKRRLVLDVGGVPLDQLIPVSTLTSLGWTTLQVHPLNKCGVLIT